MKRHIISILFISFSALSFSQTSLATDAEISPNPNQATQLQIKTPVLLLADLTKGAERRQDRRSNTSDRIDDKQDFREERRDCVGDGANCRSDNRKEKREDTGDRGDERRDDRQDRRRF